MYINSKQVYVEGAVMTNSNCFQWVHLETGIKLNGMVVKVSKQGFVR